MNVYETNALLSNISCDTIGTRWLLDVWRKGKRNDFKKPQARNVNEELLILLSETIKDYTRGK